MLQDDAVDGVCAAAAAEWPGDAPQENELKCEQDEPSTSVGSHGSQNPGDTCSSPHTPLKIFSAEEQHAEHTPLMMCSVTLVDCRTMVELNGNITQEEELDDGSVHAEEPEELEEPEEASDEFCPSSKLRSFVF